MSKRLLLTCLLLLGLPGLAAAQAPPTKAPGTTNVEVDPIRCWWRTSAGAVRIGEPFDLTLTCAVLETEAVSVVVDESRLGNAVVQMAPFEVVSGAHPADIHSGIRRFFQYEYRLRIINPDVVGKDVALPDTGLHYRVNSRIEGNAAIQGRDLMYYLPPQAMRVLSVVPEGAGDIRDTPGASFGRVDELTFRAGLFNIVAIALIAFGALVVLLVLVRLARGRKRRTASGERVLSIGSMLGVATREFAAVKGERPTAGWTDDLADRALAATRIAAAGAIGTTIGQRTAAASVTVGEGRLTTGGPRRGTRSVVSAPTTAHDVSRVLASLPESDPRRSSLEELRDALTTFTSSQYGREAGRNESALDDALAGAMRAATSVRAEHVFPRSFIRRWTATPDPMESRA